MFERLLSRLVIRPLLAAGMAATLSLGAAAPAWAQATGGWTLNIVNNGPDPIPAGGELSFAVRVDNNANDDRPPTAITFTIPAASIYVGVDGFDDCSPAPDGMLVDEPLEVTCAVPALAYEESVSGTVRFRPMEADVITFTGAIADPGPTVSVNATVLIGADLGLELEHAHASVPAGGLAEFTARIVNHGPYPANEVTLDIPVPAGLSSDFTLLPEQCSIVGDIVRCVVTGPIAPDASVGLDFSTQVVIGNQSNVTITGTLSDASPRDGVADNNTAAVDLAIEPGTDVGLVKSRAPQGALFVDDEVTFTLEPRLIGTMPGSATIRDQVPVNYEVTGVTPVPGSGWQCLADGNEVECSFSASDGNDFTAPITISAIARLDTGDSFVTNEAEIESPDETSQYTENNFANDGRAYIERAYVDLVAYKSGPREGLVAVGNTYQYRLRSRNEGTIGFHGELTITDFLPPELKAVSITAPSGWTCEQPSGEPGGQLVCVTQQYTENSPLEPGEWTGDILIDVEVVAAGSFANGMLVAFDDYETIDDNPANNYTETNGRGGEGDQLSDLRVNKRILTPASAEVAAGDELVFEIEIVNQGPATATRVVLDDRLNDIVASATGGKPVGVTPAIIAGGASGIACSVPATSGFSLDLQCIVDTLPVCTEGEDCPVIQVPIRPGSEGEKTNTAVVFSMDVPDPVLANNEDSASYVVTPKTDVTVEKTSVAEVRAGQPLVYTIAARVPLTGLSGADNVVIEDVLPDGLYFVSATVENVSCGTVPDPDLPTGPGNNSVVCDLGRIANGSQRTAVIRVIPTSPLVNQDIVNNVTVTTDTEETDEDNNAASRVVRVLPPELDLIVSKTDNHPENLYDPVLKGNKTVYTINVVNVGPSDAFDVTITDVLPEAGFADPIVHAPAGICVANGTSPTVPGGTIVCSLDRLRANETFSFQIEMTSLERGIYQNAVEVESYETRNGWERPAGNNRDTETTTVRVKSDVSVEKTTTATEVDLREPFAWDIVVRSLEGAGLEVAENVILSDTLPEGMELTAVPEIIDGPAGHAATCTGVVGQRDIRCELGDMEPGTAFTVRIVTKITEPGVTSNTATVTTDSFDQNPGNNSSTGTIGKVRGSSISGNVWRDFNADDDRADHDSGIAGVTVTITGTASHDGATITRTVTTDAQGRYEVADLPPGTYTVTYGNVPEASRYDPGKALPGSTAGGTPPGVSGSNSITGIVTVGEFAAEQHDFTLVPKPSIGLSKVAQTPVFENGYYRITYTLKVKNLSMEPLTGILLTDDLSRIDDHFGTLAAGATPAEGEYAVASVQVSGFDGGLSGDGSFNGATDTTMLSGAKLAPNATGTVTLVLLVNPDKPWTADPLRLNNQAHVAASGEYSGKTVEDDSDRRANGENNPSWDMPTFVDLTPAPSIGVEKSAALTQQGSVAGVGDRIDYTIKITNTGNTPLFDVTLDDPLPGLTDLDTTPIARLDPGVSVTRTAYYIVTQDDLDVGKVVNTATATGTWAEIDGSPKTVTGSDTETVPGLASPGLSLVKTADDAGINDPTRVGDTIRYTLTVENTGNTTLDDVVIDEQLAGVTPEDGMSFSVGRLDPGATATVYATYAVTQADIDAGEVINVAVASATHGPDQNPVNSDEATETVPLYQQPVLLAEKSVGTVSAEPRDGDAITWQITVTNDGNVTLKDITVTEPDFPGAVVSPQTIASLDPGESETVTVTATIAQTHIEAGTVRNVATVDFKDPGGTPQEPLHPEADTPLNRLPAVELVKTIDFLDGPTPPEVDQEVAFHFIIRNTGNIALTGFELVDHLDGVQFDAGTEEMLASLVLDPAEVAGGTSEITVTGRYALTTDDIDAGELENEATVTAVPAQPHPDDQPVSDDDTVYTELVRAPAISLEKSVAGTAFSTPPAPGDEVTFAFKITNTGNVTIRDIDLVDLLDGVTLTAPDGWTGELIAGASATFTGTYALVQADIDRGKLVNEAVVTGSSAGGTPRDVTDSSEVELPIERQTGLSIVKDYEATLSEPSQPDEVVTYIFTVTNTGNVTLKNVVVTDALPGLEWSEQEIAVLLPGEDNAVTLTATYKVTQADIQAGKIVNQATATAEFDDPETGETGEIEAVSEEITIPLVQDPRIAIVKTAVSSLGEPAFAGEQIDYYFTVKNTGNLELTDIVIEDPLPGIEPGRFEIASLAPGEESEPFHAVYRISEDDIDAEQVVNQATATANYRDGDGNSHETSDLSGPDWDSDQPTVVPVIPPEPEMSLVKTGRWNDENGNSYPEAGETITYEFVVRNTGNAALYNVRIEDAGPQFNGQAATNALSAITPETVTLEPQQEQRFTATYVLAQEDIDAAAGLGDTIVNVARVVGELRNGRPWESPETEARVTLPAAEPSNVILTKQAVLRQVRRGDRVPYIIRVENTSSSNAGPVDIIDTMPSGFRYVEDSATLDGQKVTPTVEGRRIVFADLQLGAHATREIRLELQVLSTAGPGTHTNVASVIDQFGDRVARDATADVEIIAEPVFDCGDIIGTVFDDRNRNGYQDDGEPGLPGVRLATAKGWLITTDRHGRFHVPCAVLPDQRIGSNFIMKLDPRTLPTGYRLTTENPRVVRLTAGKMTKVNFGASISRVIRLDLQDGAFAGGGLELAPQWEAGLGQLVEILKQEPSVLRLNYVAKNTDKQLASRRMSRIRDRIERLWKERGAAYQLEIEIRIEVGQ